MSIKSKITTSLLAGAGIAALGALAWGTLVEPHLFTVRRHRAEILPKGVKPIRILHISDLHLAPWQSEKQEWLRLLAGLKPDLVVATGDFYGHKNALNSIKYALSPLAGIPGVFVYGSNDYYGPRFKNPLDYLTKAERSNDDRERLDNAGLSLFLEEELGWINLNNNVAVVDLKDVRLEFLGVNDAHENWDELDELPGELDELREEAELPESSLGSVTIGITHAPYRRVLNNFTTYGASLILAGHTHGGQVRVPGLSSAPTTNSDLPGEYARGLHLWKHARKQSVLSVSAGVGTSIFAPVRFACRPEVTLLSLTPAE